MKRHLWRSTPSARARPIALLLLVSAAAAWLYAHEGHEALATKGATPLKDAAGQLIGVALAPEAIKALDVAVAEVAPVTLDGHLAAPAVVVAPWQRHAFVSAPLAGRIVALRARPGQRVAAGEPVAEVESLELADLQRELLDARTEAELAAKNLADLQEGNRRGSIPEPDVREAASLHRQYLDALDATRQKLLGFGIPAGTLEQLLSGQGEPVRALAVQSSVEGVVNHVDVAVGQVVEPGNHLMEVMDPRKVWVRIDVLEKDLHRVRAGQRVSLRFAALPNDDRSGTVSLVGLYLDEETHRGQVWIDLDNADGRLRAGMNGYAEIRLPAARAGLLVPPAALIAEGAEQFVLVESAPGQYRRQNVIVEARSARGVQVSRTTGLFPGDRVVTVGGHELAAYFAQGVLRLSPEAERGIELRVEPAARRPVAPTIAMTGEVELPPGGKALVASRVAGTLRRVVVERDQAVRAGDVLGEVFSAELIAAQGDLLRAEAQARLQTENLKWLRRAAGGVVPERTVRESEAALATARQRGESLRRKLREMGLSAEHLRDLQEKRRIVSAVPIRAPVAGTVVRFRAVLGQAVKPEDPLFEIHDLSGALLRIHVPERELPLVRPGSVARVRLTADPTFDGEAVVTRSGQVLDVASRTVPAWAELKAVPPAGLRDGMLAQVELPIGAAAEALAVPAEAVLWEGTDAYLFIRRKDGAFERRPVEAGRPNGRLVEIRRGLTEGELVAVRGVADLQTGWAGLR